MAGKARRWLPVIAWGFIAINTLGSIMFTGHYSTRNNFHHASRVQEISIKGVDAPSWGGSFSRDKAMRFHQEGGAYSLSFAIHVTLGAAWYLLSPLQLVRTSSKFPSFHRWNGRVQISVALMNSMTGTLFLGKHAGLFMQWTCYVYGPLCFVIACLAWKAARGRHFENHRILAQRLMGYLTAVPFARLMWLPFVQYHLGTDRMFSDTPPDEMTPAEVDAILSRFFHLTFPVACVFCIGMAQPRCICG